jgi:hypothetical protein
MAEEEIESEFVFTTNTEYISAAYFALSAIDDIDTAMMDNKEKGKIKIIKSKSIDIIYMCIKELYDECYPNDEV